MEGLLVIRPVRLDREFYKSILIGPEDRLGGEPFAAAVMGRDEDPSCIRPSGMCIIQILELLHEVLKKSTFAQNGS